MLHTNTGCEKGGWLITPTQRHRQIEAPETFTTEVGMKDVMACTHCMTLLLFCIKRKSQATSQFKGGNKVQS